MDASDSGGRQQDEKLRIADELTIPGSRQAAQISVNDYPVETVVTKISSLPNSFMKVSIGRRPPQIWLDNKIIGQTTGGFKISDIFGSTDARYRCVASVSKRKTPRGGKAEVKLISPSRGVVIMRPG